MFRIVAFFSLMILSCGFDWYPSEPLKEPRGAFILDFDHQRWELASSGMEENDVFYFAFNHLEEPISAVTMLLPISSIQMPQMTDEALMSIFRSVVSTQFEDAFIQENVCDLHLHGGLSGLLVKAVCDVAAEDDEISIYVDAKLLRGEDYLLFHMVYCLSEESYLNCADDIFQILEALTIEKSYI